jgi:predicted esterase
MVALRTLIVQPLKQHKSTIFFLHGLGDSGAGWEPVGRMLQPLFPNTKFVFPHAPSIPVTLNFNQTMPAWYDLYSLDKSVKKQDKEGILLSVSKIESLINQEIDLGIDSSQIILGGFSQGAAVSLITGLTTKINLGGIFGLSGYLPIFDSIPELYNNTKGHWFQGHGNADEVVAFKWGFESYEALVKLGLSVDFRAYQGLGHSCNDQEIKDLSDYFKRILK